VATLSREYRVVEDEVGCARAAQSARDHAEHCGDRFVRGRVEWIEGLLAATGGG
jgi:hypothetical protein